jgi:hypothetical protein
VSPQDAASNAAKWIAWLGYTPPGWLISKHLDRELSCVFVIALLLTLLWIFWPQKEAKIEQNLASHDNIDIDFDPKEVEFFLQRINNGVRYHLSRFPVVVRNTSLTRTLYDVAAHLDGAPEFLYALFEGGENSLVGGLYESQPFSYLRPIAAQIDPGRSVSLDFADNKFGPSAGAHNPFKSKTEFTISVSARDTTKKTATFRYDPNAISDHFKRLS